MRQELGMESHIVERGVDLEKFKPINQEIARSEIGWSNQEKHILFPYSPQRNKKNYPLAETVIQEVNDTLEEDIVIHTVYNEPHEKIPLFMNAADLLLMTSRPKSEGSPNTVKEALACNTPIVSTNVGDVTELIGNVSGCHVCTNKEELVEKSIESLKSVSEMNGRIKAKNLSWDKTTKQIKTIYQN
jgi:glycosyltransferase involved in cell wall biosynthesis